MEFWKRKKIILKIQVEIFLIKITKNIHLTFIFLIIKNYQIVISNKKTHFCMAIIGLLIILTFYFLFLQSNTKLNMRKLSLTRLFYLLIFLKDILKLSFCSYIL